MVEQAADLDQVRDRGEQAESAAAARAGQCVNTEGPAHQSGPTARRLDAESAGARAIGFTLSFYPSLIMLFTMIGVLLWRQIS